MASKQVIFFVDKDHLSVLEGETVKILNIDEVPENFKTQQPLTPGIWCVQTIKD